MSRFLAEGDIIARPMLRLLDRYILAEIVGPLILGLLVYTFILLIQVLFRSAELIIGSGVALGTVGQMLLLSLPHILVMTIPMSMLFGILIGVGRLSTDSELVAIRASGISLFSLYRPILLLSLLLFGINVHLMLEVLPEGNKRLQELRLAIMTQGLTEEIQPRVPHTGWQGKMLYIFETPPAEDRWKGVFLADAVPLAQSQVVVSEWGAAQSTDAAPGAAGQVRLELDGSVSHTVNLDEPDDYQVLRQQEVQIALSAAPQQAATSVSKSIRELRLSELRRWQRDDNLPDTVRNLASVEIHKRFSFPAACLVFGLLGLPLGFVHARGGRSAGFALSIGVILVYYVIFNTGEEAARDGTVPAWLAVWLPNVLMFVAGVFLLARRNRDKSLLLQGFDRWIQNSLWSRLLRVKSRRDRQRSQRRERVQRARRSANLVLRLPELRLRFPNALDRYILLAFFRVLFVAGFSGLSVFLIADLTENVEDILENDVPWSVIADYYKYKSFSAAYEIAPIIVLVTTLTTFGLLSRSNEITAAKALGISLYRMAFPVVLAAGLVAGLAGVLQSEVLPAANSRVAELKDVIKGRESIQRLGQRADRRWLYSKSRQLYNYRFYDAARDELQRLQIFKFDEQYRLVGRLFAERARHVEDQWWLVEDGWVRTFDGAEVTGYAVIDEPMKYRIEEAPDYFAGGLTSPDEMSYRELRDYIDELRSAGQDVPGLEVSLYNKVAYPVISLVMALVGLPFAFRLGRRGALYGVGLSIILGIVLMVVLGVFTALGETAILPPALAIWSPAVLFSIFSLYLFLGVRS